MSKIILHIGTHKTATTTLQATLAANRSIAARAGLIFPEVPSVHSAAQAGQHGLCMQWIKLPETYRLKRNPKEVWHEIVKAHASGHNTVIISSEELSRGQPENRVDYAELREWLNPFDRVEVVCMLREQVSFIQSIYLEVFKKRPDFVWESYFRSSLEKHLGTGVHLDYGALHTRLLQGFNPGEITYLPFRPAGAESHDPIRSLLDHFGFPSLIDEMVRVDRNISGDPLTTWIAGQFGDAWTDPRIRERVVQMFGGRKTVMYARPEYQKVIDTFAPINAAFLARDVGLTEGDLSFAEYKQGREFFRNEITPARGVKMARDLVGIVAGN
ncbi:hypothetical protein JSE7799_02880 [Jannaschia seosinensis]|uniref:Sulfotransferase family protein n=1 Tax=Jannaschia seosinensis TaxID=313367 RepID=A0A0M7BBP1_9RHOB|nr:hypothetical protein [Jannaschia seosinensis]CUH40150.1 hypothetical protein JSE7799_02880 [Jannaschia seosinensis]